MNCFYSQDDFEKQVTRDALARFHAAEIERRAPWRARRRRRIFTALFVLAVIVAWLVWPGI